jgi:hypothetical protein
MRQHPDPVLETPGSGEPGGSRLPLLKKLRAG